MRGTGAAPDTVGRGDVSAGAGAGQSRYRDLSLGDAPLWMVHEPYAFLGGEAAL